MEEIKYFQNKFKKKKKILFNLDAIREAIKNASLYPVHGDLQKQNIVINKKGLVLIDFEHFCFAPLELELVNSIYFNDANCLDVESIVPRLLVDKIISNRLLRVMLKYYSIKQLAQGKSENHVSKQYKRAVNKLNNILNKIDTKTEENWTHNLVIK